MRSSVAIVSTPSLKPFIVIGDAILDEYVDMEVNRISPEAPVPVGLVKSKSYKVGGAANVACILASLNSRVDLACLVGSDQAGGQIKDICSSRNVNILLNPSHSVSTITKTRFVSNGNHLLRVDEEVIEDKSDLLQKANVIDCSSDYEYCIISDYGKGFVGLGTCNYLRELSCKLKILVDPKSSNLDLYQNIFLLKPNKVEFEKLFKVGIKHLESKLNLILDMLLQNNIQNLLVTCGDKGAYLIETATSQITHIKAPNKDVFDVTGAGDVAIAALCKSLSISHDLRYACQVAINLASLSVQHFGTWHPSLDDLTDSMKI